MRYLIETRNTYGKTLCASVETDADAAYATLLEHLHCAGFPTEPSDDFGSPSDAVYAIGEPGSEPEVWESGDDSPTAKVYLQAIR